jgi:hypothetical protein
MAIPAVDFHLFPQLPAELREEIWRLCIPQRVCELDMPVDDIVFYEEGGTSNGPWPCELFHTTDMNKRPPLISQVCHESRAVAFKNGSIVREQETEAWPYLKDQWGSFLDVHNAWRDLARDTTHRNWSAACEAEYQYNYNASPFPQLVEEVSRIRTPGSLMSDSLGECLSWPNEVFPDPPFEPPFSPLEPQKLRDLQTLQHIPEWSVVMRTIVIHSDIATAAKTGLWGLLGDARVQIVDVSDQARMKVFFDLAETCERSHPRAVRQNLCHDAEEPLKEVLRRQIMEQFHSVELTATMRPAIMFRLCTRMCDDRGHEYSRRGTAYEGT